VWDGPGVPAPDGKVWDVRHFNSSQFRSPQQVVEGIALWHGKWVSVYSSCDFVLIIN